MALFSSARQRLRRCTDVITSTGPKSFHLSLGVSHSVISMTNAYYKFQVSGPKGGYFMDASASTTLTGTIVKIDTATGTVVIKDQYGKLWEILVPPESGINLSQYRVGDKVQATFEYYTPPGSKVTRARISKTQLIKLQ
jgi:hypothetical protein